MTYATGFGQVEAPAWDAQEALEWLQDRAHAILGLERAILDLQHRAAVLSARAREAGRERLAEEAKTAIRILGEINQAWTPIKDRMVELFAALGLTPQGSPVGFRGLGLFVPTVPVALAAAVIATAGGAWLLFRRFNEQERLLDMIEAGVISAEEAQGITRAGWLGSAERIGKLAVVGLGLMVALRIFEELRT